MNTKALRNAELELRRGLLTLSVLSQLQKPHYGYSLLQVLDKKGMDIDQNTLYPMLRRLEEQGFLNSNWSVEESRPRKYYVLNEQGKEALAELKRQWHVLAKAMNGLLEKKGDSES